MPVDLVPAAVVVVDVAVGARAPDEVRHRLGDGAKLLAAFVQLLFSTLPFGDVDHDAGDAHWAFGAVAHGATRAEQPDLAAGRVQHAVFGAELSRVERPLQVLLHARTVRRVHAIEEPGQAHARVGHHAEQQAIP